ncbi:hypothetical protein RhiirB3_390894 [Rhizophagus irregularis]|nr:hypothetical protein RhiirB3_390894 [Rhizophagus irregularis]
MFKTEGESSTKPLQKQGKKGGSEERSWIWNYYEKLVAKSPYIRTVKYQVEIYGKKGLQPYGKIMNSKDYSTSNYIAHLNTAHDKQAKKDGKQLKDINLTEDEWNAISELISILEPFANATELLGGSQYVTFCETSIYKPSSYTILRGISLNKKSCSFPKYLERPSY